jgi:putative tryptophan/tyrosine transport system substrate-binding protein
VMFGADPVELGFAGSLARPGSNVTGIAIFASELDAKRVELLHGALPSARTLAVLMDVSIAGAATRRRRISNVAAQLGLKVVVIEAEAPHAYEGAFDAMKAAGAEGLAIGASPQFSRDGAPLAELALDRQLATICQWREMAEQGCLLSYGPSRPELFRRTASFLGRILKGELASEVPIERPTKFELVINLNTAKALGLTIPPTLLARADEVIE